MWSLDQGSSKDLAKTYGNEGGRKKWNGPRMPKKWNGLRMSEEWNGPRMPQEWNGPMMPKEWNGPRSVEWAGPAGMLGSKD